jgi:hypothetical protein
VSAELNGEQPECPGCKGKGWVLLLVTRQKCPDCDGSGIIGGRFGGDADLEFDDEDTPPRGTKTRRS